jgi:hypothetical protein
MRYMYVSFTSASRSKGVTVLRLLIPIGLVVFELVRTIRKQAEGNLLLTEADVRLDWYKISFPLYVESTRLQTSLHNGCNSRGGCTGGGIARCTTRILAAMVTTLTWVVMRSEFRSP